MTFQRIVSLFLVASLVAPASAADGYFEGSYGPNPYRYANLRSWSIRVIGPQASSGRWHSKEWLVQYPLSRPGEKNVVAIVGVRPNRTPELNPEGFHYGPIPNLSDMSPAHAKELWAPENDGIRPPANCTQTYKLISNIYKRDFEIELEFKNDKLQKYQLRISEPQPVYSRFDQMWISIN